MDNPTSAACFCEKPEASDFALGFFDNADVQEMRVLNFCCKRPLFAVLLSFMSPRYTRHHNRIMSEPTDRLLL